MSVNDNPNDGQQRNGSAHPSEEPVDPLAEAEELRTMLQAALMRTSRLIGSLKHQRRENRAVQAAMESLRRLRPIDR